MGARETLTRNKWRYISLILGFFLFVGPFALIARGIGWATGDLPAPTTHTLCFRMSVDMFIGGRFSALIGSVAATFILGVIIITLFFGSVFCGWLCPVGSVSETTSRVVPLRERFRLRIKDPAVTKALRYGFFAGFAAVAILVGYKLASISGICCRHCTSSILQNMADSLTGQTVALAYWHTGSIITLFSWLLIGGVFVSGGRGWCLFFCPLSVLSNFSHTLGKIQDVPNFVRQGEMRGLKTMQCLLPELGYRPGQVSRLPPLHNLQGVHDRVPAGKLFVWKGNDEMMNPFVFLKEGIGMVIFDLAALFAPLATLVPSACGSCAGCPIAGGCIVVPAVAVRNGGFGFRDRIRSRLRERVLGSSGTERCSKIVKIISGVKTQGNKWLTPETKKKPSEKRAPPPSSGVARATVLPSLGETVKTQFLNRYFRTMSMLYVDSHT